MSRRHELTDYEKGQIEARSGTMSHAKIGNELSWPCRTVSNFLQRLHEHENKENLLWPAALRKQLNPVIDTLFMQRSLIPINP